MVIDTRKLRSVQRAIASEAVIEDSFENVERIASFDCAFFGDKMVCAAVVIDAKTFKILESKHLITKTPMPYIPGYLAFREGPAILQLYYELEYDPDIIIVEGHGIAHPLGCGLATYIGVELTKPTIGVAKKLLVGDVEGENILVQISEDKKQLVGKLVVTKAFACPLYISPGHLISVETAAKIITEQVVPPHKLPEALHKAHKIAKRELEKFQKPIVEQKEVSPIRKSLITDAPFIEESIEVE